MKVIGLTGGIGCGKSTVAAYLKEMGATVYDLDKIGHDVYRKNSLAYKAVVTAFSKEILTADGKIDRAKLGRVVFHNSRALRRLNKIVHPAIDKIIERNIEQGRKKGVTVMVMEAAAMLEAGRAWQADEIWVVTCPEKSVMGRIKTRPGYNEEIVKSRIRSQITDGERLTKADVVIANFGTLDELKAKVKIEWDKLQKRL